MIWPLNNNDEYTEVVLFFVINKDSYILHTILMYIIKLVLSK